VIGQDNSAWASDERDGPKETASPSLHDQSHPDGLQPVIEKTMDAEWESVGPAVMVRSKLHTENRNRPFLIVRYAALTQIYKTNVVTVCTQCAQLGDATHKTLMKYMQEHRG